MQKAPTIPVGASYHINQKFLFGKRRSFLIFRSILRIILLLGCILRRPTAAGAVTNGS